VLPTRGRYVQGKDEQQMRFAREPAQESDRETAHE
jgi:hypothetical protein